MIEVNEKKSEFVWSRRKASILSEDPAMSAKVLRITNSAFYGLSGTVDSVKAVSELFAPVSGKIVRINTELEDQPELLNDDCFEKGWLVAMRPADASALDGLLDPDAYTSLCQEQD